MFDCSPSDIETVYWKYTRHDIKVKLRLYVALRQIDYMQQFQSMAILAGKLFGGGKSTSSSEIVEPKNEAEMLAAFNSVFGKR